MKVHIHQRNDIDFVDRLFGWKFFWMVRDSDYRTLGSGLTRTEGKARKKAEKLAAKTRNTTWYDYEFDTEG